MSKPLLSATKVLAEEFPLEPSGEQWSIAHGTQRAIITQVGATIRSFTDSGRSLIDGFGPGEWPQGSRGQVLAPWPNRIEDGRYEFAGRHGQAALDEPDKFNAIHGLVRWLPWCLESQAQNVLVVGIDLRPTPGYPFTLRLRIEYRLSADGLSVTTEAINAGDCSLPFGLGFHPYLCASDLGSSRLWDGVLDGDTEGGGVAEGGGGVAEGGQVEGGVIDSAHLLVPAQRRLILDSRFLPTGDSEVLAGTAYDFTSRRQIGSLHLDTPFTSLIRGDDGLARACLTRTDGRGVELWVDDHFGYLMVYTGDTLSDPNSRRRSVAIEPMTCPPNAFRTGRDLIVMDPGQRWSGSWGLRAI